MKLILRLVTAILMSLLGFACEEAQPPPNPDTQTAVLNTPTPLSIATPTSLPQPTATLLSSPAPTHTPTPTPVALGNLILPVNLFPLQGYETKTDDSGDTFELTFDAKVPKPEGVTYHWISIELYRLGSESASDWVTRRGCDSTWSTDPPLTRTETQVRTVGDGA